MDLWNHSWAVLACVVDPPKRVEVVHHRFQQWARPLMEARHGFIRS